MLAERAIVTALYLVYSKVKIIGQGLYSNPANECRFWLIHNLCPMNFDIILITSPDRVEREESKLIALFEKGLTTLHVRKPDWTEAELEQYIQSVPSTYHSRLVVHSHYSLATTYNLKGIHLTERSQRDKATLAYLKKLSGKAVSASFHQLSQVLRHRRRYQYVFLSPIFDSISKKDYQAHLRLDTVKRRLAELQKRKNYVPKVVALGGIEASNVQQVKQAGFAGAALLGAIWQSADPIAAFVAIQAKAAP